MKKILLVLFVIILFLAFILKHNNNSKVIISKLTGDGNIKSGDLVYKVNLLGILPIGEAIFEVEKVEKYNDQKVYHLRATAQSLKVFSKIFSGSAVLDSYVDMQQLNPILFKQKLIIPGKPNIEKEVIYDQKNNTMSLAGVKRQILPNTQDPLSAILNFRRMDFNKINEIEMNINTNQKNYILKGTIEHRDILINKKIYKTILAKAEIRRRDKDNPYHQSKITVILLKGKENVPILIKIFASGVLITARLTDINQ